MIIFTNRGIQSQVINFIDGSSVSVESGKEYKLNEKKVYAEELARVTKLLEIKVVKPASFGNSSQKVDSQIENKPIKEGGLKKPDSSGGK